MSQRLATCGQIVLVCFCTAQELRSFCIFKVLLKNNNLHTCTQNNIHQRPYVVCKVENIYTQVLQIKSLPTFASWCPDSDVTHRALGLPLCLSGLLLSVPSFLSIFTSSALNFGFSLNTSGWHVLIGLRLAEESDFRITVSHLTFYHHLFIWYARNCSCCDK